MFRFLPYARADAATNMAVDEAVLEAHRIGLVAPTLRLYGFSPPAVSLGRCQRLPDGLLARVRQAGFDVVRRPTGGRAVLHLNDLTYSFVGRSTGVDVLGKPVLASSVAAAYRQICGGIIRAFEILGVSVDLGATGGAYRNLYDCFRAVTTADLHYRGMKMVGSAQLRRGGAVLQHGSILLNQEQTKMAELCGCRDQSGGGQRHANLFEIAGRHLAIGELQEAFKTGFAQAFSREIADGQLTDYEMREARRLKANYTAVAPLGTGTVSGEVAFA